jgi:hypothetical protein
LAFFPLYWSWRHRSLATCADVVSLGWRSDRVTAPHTYCGSGTIEMGRAERGGVLLYGREPSPCPPTVLGKGMAQRRALASARQVRGRGSTHGPGVRRAAAQEPERMSKHRPRDQGKAPLGSSAFADAARASEPHLAG